MPQTEALYMDDCYVKECDATVTDIGEDENGSYLVLDRTVFYPAGGGQPADVGHITTDKSRGLDALNVDDVQKRGGEIRHYVEPDEEHGRTVPEAVERGEQVHATVNWMRREKLMKLHTAQHVISAIVLEAFDAETAGNQIFEDYSRIDFSPVSFTAADIETIEGEANRIIDEEHPVKMYEEDRAVVEEEVGGRGLLDLIPDSIDPLRVVEIEGVDLCPCGGTHVKNTGEIGGITITDWEKKGGDTYRIYFERSA